MFINMFKQAICLTHYSQDFVKKLEMLGYEKDSYYSFDGNSKTTRDDICVCTSVNQFEPDPDPARYILVDKASALSNDPRISWVNKCAHRYITDDEDLAFALASLRDDNITDKYQFFTIECNFQFDNKFVYKQGALMFCTRNEWNLDFDNERKPLKFSSRNVPAHKSTKEEILEFFDKKDSYIEYV